MIWFIEPSVFSEDLKPLLTEIVRQGHTIEDVRYIPFVMGKYDFTNKPGVFYGSLNMAKFLRGSNPGPLIYCTLENYDCSRYYAHLGKYLLNENYAFVPFAELKRNKDFYYEKFGQADTIFVRPSAGDKTFTGQLVNKEDFDRDYTRMGSYDMPPDKMVVVSEPRNLVGEWRFIVVDKKIVAGSAYKKSEASIPDEAHRLAEEIAAAGYEPDKCWSLDVCQTKSGFYLLEIGSFSCSGLYKCDMEPIVREVSRVSLEHYQSDSR